MLFDVVVFCSEKISGRRDTTCETQYRSCQPEEDIRIPAKSDMTDGSIVASEEHAHMHAGKSSRIRHYCINTSTSPLSAARERNNGSFVGGELRLICTCSSTTSGHTPVSGEALSQRRRTGRGTLVPMNRLSPKE